MDTSSPRPSNRLGRRSILARIGAVLALVGCGIAIYLLVMNFTESEGASEAPERQKNRPERGQNRDAAAPAGYARASGSLGLPSSSRS